jgi:hypothetical membrane protein
VIYLMGTLAGVLPRSPYLIFTSVTVLLMGLAYGLTVLGIVMRGQKRTYVIGTAMIMLGVPLIGASFIRTSGITWPEKVTMPVAGVILRMAGSDSCAGYSPPATSTCGAAQVVALPCDPDAPTEPQLD